MKIDMTQVLKTPFGDRVVNENGNPVTLGFFLASILAVPEKDTGGRTPEKAVRISKLAYRLAEENPETEVTAEDIVELKKQVCEKVMSTTMAGFVISLLEV